MIERKKMKVLKDILFIVVVTAIVTVSTLFIISKAGADPVAAPSPMVEPAQNQKTYDKVWVKNLTITAPNEVDGNLSVTFDFYYKDDQGKYHFAGTPKTMIIPQFQRVTDQNQSLNSLVTQVVSALVQLAHAQGKL